MHANNHGASLENVSCANASDIGKVREKYTRSNVVMFCK